MTKKLKSLTWQKLRNRLTGLAFYLRYKSCVDFLAVPIVEGCMPKLYNGGTFKIGTGCFFRTFRVRQHISALGGASLEIGRNSFLNDGVNICAALNIIIGHSAKIGDMVTIYDTDFHPVSPGTAIRKEPVFIGNNVWIGANSMVLAGAVIGDHAVIAAGSIVTGAIPARCLAGGVPARVIRTFEAPDDWVRP